MMVPRKARLCPQLVLQGHSDIRPHRSARAAAGCRGSAFSFQLLRGRQPGDKGLRGSRFAVSVKTLRGTLAVAPSRANMRSVGWHQYVLPDASSLATQPPKSPNTPAALHPTHVPRGDFTTETPHSLKWKNVTKSGAWWLTPAIPATWEPEMRRISVRGQPGQMVFETPSQPIAGPGGPCL